MIFLNFNNDKPLNQIYKKSPLGLRVARSGYASSSSMDLGLMDLSPANFSFAPMPVGVSKRRCPAFGADVPPFPGSIFGSECSSGRLPSSRLPDATEAAPLFICAAPLSRGVLREVVGRRRLHQWWRWRRCWLRGCRRHGRRWRRCWLSGSRRHGRRWRRCWHRESRRHGRRWWSHRLPGMRQWTKASKSPQPSMFAEHVGSILQLLVLSGRCCRRSIHCTMAIWMGLTISSCAPVRTHHLLLRRSDIQAQDIGGFDERHHGDDSYSKGEGSTQRLI